MFTRSDDKITASQAAVFLNNTVLGAGILTLPRSVSQSVKTPDSLLSVLLGGVIVMAVIVLMVKISQQFPGKTVFQYAGKIIGRVPGGILCILLIMYFLIIAGFEIRSLAEVTLFFLLRHTDMGSDPSLYMGRHLSRVWRYQFNFQSLPSGVSDQHHDSAHFLRFQPAAF